MTVDKNMHARSAAMHEKIFDAIAARNQKAAARAMIQVIEESLKDGSSQLTAG